MTVSVLALVTDAVRDSKPIVGYGFNSNGRYAPSGLLRDRFLPRLKAAPPDSLLDETGENFDPHRIWAIVMGNEKPGGHGERSVAVGVLDMAVWDAVAKIAGMPLHRLLANRYREGHFESKVFVYAADRKSTRLNSSHLGISYAVFCLKKQNAADYYRHR